MNEYKAGDLIPKIGVSKVIEKAGEVGDPIMFRLTEKKVDRYGEVVIPDGVQLDNYRTNPIVLFQHGYDLFRGKLPIGKTLLDGAKITSKYFDAPIQFDEDGSDPFATMLAGKYRKGFLNAGSIGFKAIEVSKDKPMKGQTGVTFKLWELMEFSGVVIPALVSALAKREFAELREAVKKQYGDESMAGMDDLIEKFYTFSNDDLDYAKDIGSDIYVIDTLKELRGRLISIEDQLKVDDKTPPLPVEEEEEVKTYMSAETADELSETLNLMKQTSEQIVASLKS
jgi:hypothetical protein